jgi:hypothetical protein
MTNLAKGDSLDFKTIYLKVDFLQLIPIVMTLPISISPIRIVMHKRSTQNNNKDTPIQVDYLWIYLKHELKVNKMKIKQIEIPQRQNRIDNKEEFEDTKGTIRICISNKNRQHKGQKKKYKRTNNDLQNIHIKLKIE